MKKRTKILIIIGLLLVVLGYFGYKVVNLLILYNFHDEDIFDLEIKDSVNLKYYQELEEGEEYLEFKNIKLRNDFKEFEYREDISTEDDAKYVLYDENNEVKASFWIGVVPTYVETLKSDITIFASDGVSVSESDKDSVKTFLKENGIKNDIHLFKYLIEHKDDKSNIFTSVKKLRENYILYYLMNVMLPGDIDMTLIDGTYAGYILNLNSGVKEACILYYDKCYVFTFVSDDYFSDDYIYDLLDTIVIESSTDESGKVVLTDKDNTFTRTYSVIDVIFNNSLEYDSFEIKQFQDEETIIVDIKKDLAVNILKNKNYEFTFKYTDKEVHDNLESIFLNAELISVVETDKVGLDQIQEAIK